MTSGDGASDLTHAELAGWHLVAWLVAPAIVGGLALVTGASLSGRMWLPIGLVLIGASAVHARDSGRRLVGPTVALLVLGSLCAGGAVYDTSWDGQSYHLPGIDRLMNGWNPVFGEPARHVWIDNVPKSPWTVAALTGLATGHVESAKAINVVALCAAFFLWTAVARRLGVDGRRAAVAGALFAANPIALGQLLTFYVDGFVASVFSAFVALLVLHALSGHRTHLVAASLLGALLGNSKLSGLWLVLLSWPLFAIHAWLAGERSRARRLGAAAAVSFALTAGLGINPYVTNLLRHGNALYPLGEDLSRSAFALVFHRNEEFLALPAPLRVGRSIFSAADNDDQARPELKVPFAVSAAEVMAFGDVDVRIGGWGPLFSGALVLAAASLVLGRRLRFAREAALGSLFIAVSALVIEQASWARYAPQLALIPPLAALPWVEDGARSRRLPLALALVIALNAILTFAPAFLVASARTLALVRQMRDMERAPWIEVENGLFLATTERLRGAGVDARQVTSLRCPSPAPVVRSTARYCLAGGQSPPPTPESLAAAREWLLGR